MTKETSNLSITGLNTRDDLVVLILTNESGRRFEMPLSIFEVSTLVSGLYAEQAIAMKAPRQTGPEVLLPLSGITIGEDRDQGFTLLRAHVENLHQDFAVPTNSNLGTLLLELGAKLAKIPEAGNPPHAQ